MLPRNFVDMAQTYRLMSELGIKQSRELLALQGEAPDQDAETGYGLMKRLLEPVTEPDVLRMRILTMQREPGIVSRG